VSGVVVRVFDVGDQPDAVRRAPQLDDLALAELVWVPGPLSGRLIIDFATAYARNPSPNRGHHDRSLWPSDPST